MISKAVFNALAPGDTGRQIEMPGNMVRVAEADYPFEIRFDDKDWIPFDVGVDLRARSGSTVKFSRFAIRHYGPANANFLFWVGTDVEMNDARLTISESRNGSAASYIPPSIAETVNTAGATGAWIKLLDYEPGREEVWLCTDAATAAYWNFTDAGAVSAARNLVPAAGEGRWLKLRTKSAIYVWHTEAGKSVTALTFSY